MENEINQSYLPETFPYESEISHQKEMELEELRGEMQVST